MSRKAWRDQVVETALEPDIAIVDAHHHVWEDKPFPPFDPYDDRDLLVDKTQSGHRIVGTVFVDSHTSYRSDGPEALRVVGETDYAARIAEAALARGGTEAGICAAIVPSADLRLGAAVVEVLDAHAAATPRFRGIRHMVAYDPDVPHSHHNGAGLMLRDDFRAGVAELVKRDLSFEAWLLQPQLPELITLARIFPDARIILNHLGGPLTIGRFAADPKASFAAWKADMATLATCPNVSVKVGGLNMGMAGVDAAGLDAPLGSAQLAEAQRDYILTGIDLFGPARCMFESNVPVDSHNASYTVIWNVFKRLSSGFFADERARLFKDTAMEVYRIDPALVAQG
ncbi:MAG: amidohydrolase family protein [Rhizorhabdus sp.]|uniref:amidohydrolase family protein n=1 Tax=Rhizorhabdus sp. TaxID=1968843 RepID=UPI001B446DD7|nr:amidohydrolase family protein [Rhizorhabdus sp.]MBP8232137.1 amidohydrolase family protein [Rhizorhabdus sp.]